jgi:hypothetical protein
MNHGPPIRPIRMDTSRHARSSASSAAQLPARIGAPARRALESVGITSLHQLTDLTEQQVWLLHGMGPKALDVLRDALTANGLSFVQDE